MNGEEIADTFLREEAAALRPKYYEVMDSGDPVALEMQLREWSRENVIERVLLKQEALRREVTPEDLLAQVQATVPPVKNKDVSSYYMKNRQNFWVPELIHCAHIVKNVDETHPEEPAREAILQAEKDLASGAAFAAIADRESDCPGQGGDLGWFPRGQMVPEFDQVVFGLSVGQTSPIFRTPFGFHIVRLLGRKPEGIPGLADVREHLAAQLLREKQQQAIEQFVDNLRAKAVVSL